ncbi:virulence associated protein [Undibacterium sp. JH2W]|uniref:virulence associated protein n=1 Tax=Undibacterium sp. JH2W TaxID=3413037 RepID=UPI003BF42F04
MSADGKPIQVWELPVLETDPCLNEWANRFRQHYCLDTEIDDLRDGTELSRSEYLIQLVFPDKTSPPGPAVRSGDFAELLISDYVEYRLGFWVPRSKYAEKASRNESVKGVDILGFKLVERGKELPMDTLLTFEVKAQLAGGKYQNRLQTAIDDSAKDYLRAAYTLNATKRRLLTAKNQEGAAVVRRFQNIADRPYVFTSGAAAVLSDESYDEIALQTTSAATHTNAATLELLVVRGTQLMNLVHALYEKAANEA